MLPKALSCSHVYSGRVEGGAHFILMLSVRILGGGGWHLFTSGSLAAPPSPQFYAASLFYAIAKYCTLML